MVFGKHCYRVGNEEHFDIQMPDENTKMYRNGNTEPGQHEKPDLLRVAGGWLCKNGRLQPGF